MWFDTELQSLMTNADHILTCLGLAQIFWPPYHPQALRGIEGFENICIIRQIKAVFFFKNTSDTRPTSLTQKLLLDLSCVLWVFNFCILDKMDCVQSHFLDTKVW